jgi:hypothetical protein
MLGLFKEVVNVDGRPCRRQHMICPVEIAREVSAFQAVWVGERGRHVLLPEGRRDGAGNESTRNGL